MLGHYCVLLGGNPRRTQSTPALHWHFNSSRVVGGNGRSSSASVEESRPSAITPNTNSAPRHPSDEWMILMARNATDEGSDSYVASATFFMIGIPDSALSFWMSCGQAECGHWRFHLESDPNAFSERWVCSRGKNACPKSFCSKVLSGFYFSRAKKKTREVLPI